jgi:pimeloyl-ACP methyl ester carboxylesterase
VVLIGHSNGGDMSMMFASKYKQSVAKVVSLDSLRYPFPAGVPVLHFAAEDTKADEGAVPAQGVRTVKISGAKHMDFYDPGNSRVKQETVKEIIQFLAE